MMMNPILMNNGMMGGMPNLGYDMGQPVLASGPQPVQPILTGNARGSSRLPQYPNNKINMMGEGLMRMGGSALSAVNQGPVAQLGAMFGTYGDLQDYNRSQDAAQFQAEENRRLEELRRQDLLRKMEAKEKNKEDEPTDREKLENANEIERLESILKDLETMNLTGPWAGGFGNALDGSGLMGDEAAKKTAKRKILSELQVNATLAFTAQTKGAITDREMALFQTPVPKLTEDETVWIEWIKPQLEVLRQLQTNGITDEAAKMQGIDPTTFDDGNYIVEEITPTNG